MYVSESSERAYEKMALLSLFPFLHFSDVLLLLGKTLSSERKMFKLYFKIPRIVFLFIYVYYTPPLPANARLARIMP